MPYLLGRAAMAQMMLLLAVVMLAAAGAGAEGLQRRGFVPLAGVRAPAPTRPSPTGPPPRSPPPTPTPARTPPPPSRRPPPPPPPSSDTSNCSQVSEQAEGPYWLSEDLERSDVRSDLAYGVPLNFTFRVVDAAASALAASALSANDTSPCVPLPSARVDIWHACYDGTYSGIEVDHTVNETWLRGYQLSDDSGYVTFYTIYPGWYVSRTVHVHVRVRLFGSDGTESYDETTQLYFDDDVSDAIFADVYPYNDRGGAARDTSNAADDLFSASNLLSLDGSYLTTDGYASSLDLSVPFAGQASIRSNAAIPTSASTH